MALRHLLAGLTLLPVLALTGCGQKGALYMPDQVPPPRAAETPCRTPSCAALQQTEATKDQEDQNQDTPEATDPTTADEIPE